MLNDAFWNVIGKCLESLTKQGIDFTLTIMGGSPPSTIEALKSIVFKSFTSNVLKKVNFKFNVSNEERDQELEKCSILIYPPSTEGLGMPVFEAVMKHLVVLSARQTALIEFVSPWIYPSREFRYSQFCQALVNAIVKYDEMLSHIRNVRKEIATLTLANLIKFIKIIKA